MDKKILLDARGLYKSYGTGDGETIALKGVDLRIYQDELLVILGSSGSGKSTLLNMIGGMAKPTRGEIWVDGENICQFNDRKMTAYRRDKIGFVFQSFNLIQELTAGENVALTADKQGNPNVVRDMLELVGLAHKIDKYPSQLSGGEQQRVSIARALAKKSTFLLCDEPTGALDFETGKQVLAELEALARKYGRTVVMVTHTKEISNMADRVIRMQNGLIVSEQINQHPVAAQSIVW
ncbi:MAG: ABC transporter ATP-binding protein [Faecousia sp.]